MPDYHAATELKLYIDNDGELYRRQTTSILTNLATKRARGQYRHDLAVKAFANLAEAGAKKYAKEFGSPDQPWNKMFDGSTRKLTAEALTRSFETEAALGNYDHLLPKKYRATYLRGSRAIGAQAFTSAAKGTSGHARKKPQWKTPESLKVDWSPVNRAYVALWPGRGRVQDQDVLKIGSEDEMHGWLRDTYGEPYGLAGRVMPRIQHSTISGRDIREFRGFLRDATDRQIQGIYEKEKRAGRDEYVELTVAEAESRGIDLDTIANRRAHASKKSPGQLKHEIAQVLGTRRYS